ncbi:hypothetical protein [Shimia thalassica]|uniref:hypothetical protein n=2 Tax=Shimia thalassica TaxID=1715693 RepID=UPI0026E2E474|nr:hypothetical protein [Shimia thalassica]MDO6799364.1 hypothetical protein [Shimia thalassica]
MKHVDGRKLRRQLKSLKGTTRKHVTDAIEKSTHEGVRVARVLAPEKSGETKKDIHAEFKDQGMTGTVVAIESSAPRAEKDRAYSIEHGRKSGGQGTTEGSHHIWRTRQYLQKKLKSRIRRALNKAAKEVASRG